MNDLYYTFAEVLQHLQIEAEELERMVADGVLAKVKLEGHDSFLKEEIQKLKAGKTTEDTLMIRGAEEVELVEEDEEWQQKQQIRRVSLDTQIEKLYLSLKGNPYFGDLLASIEGGAPKIDFAKIEATTAGGSSQAGPVTDEKTELKQVGDYFIQKRIGHGAMGEIYLGQHCQKSTLAAVKLLPQKADDIAVQRFRQEAQVHSRLIHPNIVRIFEAGFCSITNRLYLAMEYIKGESLEKILARRGALAQKQSLQIAIAVAHALEHALEQQIIHRDLKPANILINRQEGNIKVVDLGLGKILQKGIKRGVTLGGELMGTSHYMPPEQIHNAREVDHRADIYALGATLYHMLAGVPPYGEHKGPFNILKAKTNCDPIALQQFHPNIRAELAAIVRKAMSRNIKARYANPKLMRKDMDNVVHLLGN